MSVVDNKTVDGVALTDDKNGIILLNCTPCQGHFELV